MLNEIKYLFYNIESFLCKENICDYMKSYNYKWIFKLI